MRRILIATILIGLASYGCSPSTTSQKSAKDIKNPDEQSSTYLKLSDYLRRVPGLVVQERGADVTILVRGMSSIGGSNEPLFVIDRQIVGTYDDATAMIDPNDIARVEVLKDVASTSAYGMQGSNGVIIIHSKK